MISQPDGGGGELVPSSPRRPLEARWRSGQNLPSGRGRRVVPGKRDSREEEWLKSRENAARRPHHRR